MPLTKGLRDEENERINTLLKKLIGMDYVPENGTFDQDELLKGLAMDTKSLLDFAAENLIQHLEKLNFDFTNAEQFGDFLVQLATKLPEEKSNLHAKAIAVYQHIQSESKLFSFAISRKISALKTN